MERNYKPIDWSNFPPIEKCTPMDGDYENSKPINIDEGVITLDTSKLTIPTREEMQDLQKYIPINEKTNLGDTNGNYIDVSLDIAENASIF